MKKLTALALCLTTVFTLGTPVSAATLTSTEDGSNSVTQSVRGTYNDNSGAVVYSVDIEWSDFNFEYNTGSKGVWNPSKHEYSEAKPLGWGEQSGTIKVTNHSNAGVKYTIAYNKGDSQYDGFYLARGKGSSAMKPMTSPIASAEYTTVDEAPSHRITLYPGGTLPEGTDNAVVGTLTLTIEPNA